LKTPVRTPRQADSQPGRVASHDPEERLHWRILYRHKEGVEKDIDLIIAANGLPEHHMAVGDPQQRPCCRR
jgi:hypothetical protein